MISTTSPSSPFPATSTTRVFLTYFPPVLRTCTFFFVFRPSPRFLFLRFDYCRETDFLAGFETSPPHFFLVGLCCGRPSLLSNPAIFPALRAFYVCPRRQPYPFLVSLVSLTTVMKVGSFSPIPFELPFPVAVSHPSPSPYTFTSLSFCFLSYHETFTDRF